MSYELDELAAALDADDYLGFESVREAVHAVLSHHDDYWRRWDCSKRTIAAVTAYMTRRQALIRMMHPGDVWDASQTPRHT